MILPPLYQISTMCLVHSSVVNQQDEMENVAYNRVELNLRNAQGKDAKKLREVLGRYHGMLCLSSMKMHPLIIGRFPLSRRKR